jgi:hypothetical protein
MKKIYVLLAASGFAFGAFAQTQRTVLAEEFTQASCPPCAAQNPAFNALLAANPTKVVAIKYQTNWPGVDPMNVQTQGDVGPRVTYYACNGVPYAPMDGSVANVSSPNYAGAPANWTQTILNTEYNTVTSPFALSVSHTMSSDFDSAFVTVVITAAQNFTSVGALKLQLGMTERVVHFNAPPGTNGETDFYNVMRKMYPDANGTTLGSSWTNAQTQTLTFAVALPSYIYDKNQLNFVAFIQDDGNKTVEQAAGDMEVLVTNDASATAVTGLPSMTCSTTINPVVTIKNFGSATLTSCIVNYKVDNNAPSTYSWSGSINTNGTANAALPAVTVTGAGTHSFTSWTTMPNGTTDYNTNMDSNVGSFMIVGTAASAPLIEGYVSATFPPTGWGINNADNDAITWTRISTANCGGFHASSNTAKMDFFSSPAGTVDEMIAKNVDMTATTNKIMTFDVAYCQYSAENDQLDVEVSTDCGATWTNVYSKAGATLKTKAAQTTAFTPSAANQWRMEVVDLTPYATATSLIIKWVATSAYGNNLFVDDINIGTTGIQENADVNSISVYPNPFDQNANINLDLVKTENVTVNVYNMTGELVSVQNEGELSAGAHNIVLNGANLSDGMYFVTIVTGDATVTRKVTVSH